MERLGLGDEELCAVLDVDPLTLIGGELEHRPELAILLALTEDDLAVLAQRGFVLRGGAPPR